MKKILGLFIAVGLLMGGVVSAQTAQEKSVGYLEKNQASNGQIMAWGTVNEGVTDWAVMAYEANGMKNKALVKGMRLIRLDEKAATTTIERHMLALQANGLRSGKLKDMLQKRYNHQQLGDQTLVNDDIFGALALLSFGKKSNKKVVHDTIKFIVKNQQADGGWSYQAVKNSSTDIDTTAAAIQTLVYARSKNFKNLDTAIRNGRQYLIKNQNKDGGFGYMKGEISNSSSTAWVVQAIVALGDKPQKWQKNGKNPTKFLNSLRQKDGSYAWQKGLSGDAFSTVYVLLALSGKSLPIE